MAFEFPLASCCISSRVAPFACDRVEFLMGSLRMEQARYMARKKVKRKKKKGSANANPNEGGDAVLTSTEEDTRASAERHLLGVKLSDQEQECKSGGVIDKIEETSPPEPSRGTESAPVEAAGAPASSEVEPNEPLDVYAEEWRFDLLQWMYQHPNHSIASWVLKGSGGDVHSKISIEDPVETERLLQPRTSLSNDHIMCEFVRAAWLTGCGAPLSIVVENLLPRIPANLMKSYPYDQDHLSKLPWYRLLRSKTPTDVICQARASAYSRFWDKVRAESLLTFADATVLMEAIQSDTEKLSYALIVAEEEFIDENLRASPDGER